MSNTTELHRAVIDAFANLGADIIPTPGDVNFRRLQTATVSALHAQLQLDPALQTQPQSITHLIQAVPEARRASLMHDLHQRDSASAAGAEADATATLDNEAAARMIVRRDPRAILHPDAFIDSTSGLAPGERLGPFATHGGIDIWFDLFFPVHRTEVREVGNSVPALVMTQARLTAGHHIQTSIDIQPGTVWLRGDLIDGALPPSAFVGIKVTGGSLKLASHATLNGDVIEVTAPLQGSLQLTLADDHVVPVAGACKTADVKLALPASLTFKFNAGTSTAQGSSGTAQAWGQQFAFTTSNNN